MKLLNEPRPTVAPAICIICEQSPDEVGWVDTLRNADFYGYEGAEIPTHLTGRKFVCEPCVEEMAKLLGFVRKHKAVSELANSAAEVAELRAVLEHVREALG